MSDLWVQALLEWRQVSYTTFGAPDYTVTIQVETRLTSLLGSRPAE